MKNNITKLLMLLFFSGCYSNYHYLDYIDLTKEKPLLTDIPVKPHKEKVSIIFPGEKTPEEPYIKVDILEVSGNGRMKDLIIELQAKGQLRGVDALIIMGNDTYEETDDEYYYTTQKISALGIKFIKNIDYLEECIKRANVIAFDKKQNKYDTVAVIETDWRGRFFELKNGDPFYWDFLYNYSLQHLVEEKNSDWKYWQTMDSDGFVRTKRIKTFNNQTSTPLEIVELKSRSGITYFAKLKDTKQFSANIEFQYNSKGKLISKKIKSKIRGLFNQKFIYQEDGSLLRTDVYKINGEEEKFYFKVIFERYDSSDLKDLLEKEQS